MLAAAHPIEISLFCGSTVATAAWAYLVYLKLQDVWSNHQNGPVKFMLNDNRRRGLWMFGLSLVALRIAFIAIVAPPFAQDYDEMIQSFETICWMNVIVYGLVIEAFFTYRRREKMAYLVSKYQEATDVLAGGRRQSDPPIVVVVPEIKEDV